MPAPGVVTQVEQPDEEHAFGLAAPLVAEWRELRVGRDRAVSGVDRARVSDPWVTGLRRRRPSSLHIVSRTDLLP